MTWWQFLIMWAIILLALGKIWECVAEWWQRDHMPDVGEIPNECPLCGSIDGDCQHYLGE